jgi:hypothetical protein
LIVYPTVQELLILSIAVPQHRLIASTSGRIQAIFAVILPYRSSQAVIVLQLEGYQCTDISTDDSADAMAYGPAHLQPNTRVVLQLRLSEPLLRGHLGIDAQRGAGRLDRHQV